MHHCNYAACDKVCGVIYDTCGSGRLHCLLGCRLWNSGSRADLLLPNIISVKTLATRSQLLEVAVGFEIKN